MTQKFSPNVERALVLLSREPCRTEHETLRYHGSPVVCEKEKHPATEPHYAEPGDDRVVWFSLLTDRTVELGH